MLLMHADWDSLQVVDLDLSACYSRMQPLAEPDYILELHSLGPTLEVAVLGQMHEVMCIPGDDESRA